jgi:hypothetical protein
MAAEKFPGMPVFYATSVAQNRHDAKRAIRPLRHNPLGEKDQSGDDDKGHGDTSEFMINYGERIDQCSTTDRQKQASDIP